MILSSQGKCRVISRLSLHVLITTHLHPLAVISQVECLFSFLTDALAVRPIGNGSGIFTGPYSKPIDAVVSDVSK